MEHGTWNMKHETKNTKLKNLYAHQFVISPTPRPVIDVDGIFVLGLPVTAVYRFRTGPGLTFTKKQILIVVSALFEKQRFVIQAIGGVVIHSGECVQPVVVPVSTQKDISLNKRTVYGQIKIHKHIIGFHVRAFYRVLIVDHESSVHIKILHIGIVCLNAVFGQINLIIRSVKFYLSNALIVIVDG